MKRNESPLKLPKEGKEARRTSTQSADTVPTDLPAGLRQRFALWRTETQSRFALEMLRVTQTVSTPAGRLSFVLFGKTATSRAKSVLTKQPGTIDWIDRFEPGTVFWDIGANVGVFSLYAARRGHARVFAFEPAAVNYFLLSANCEVNQLDIDCLLVGIGEKRGVERLEVSQFDPARSFSFRPKAGKRPSGRQAALIVSIDELVEQFGLPCPTYIKLDVPGLTEAIIAGGERTLRRQEVREFHIELREHSSAGRRIVERLEAAGLVAVDRHVHGSTTDVTFVRRLP